MYQKYFVYVDDGENVFKVAVAAVSEEAAKAWSLSRRRVRSLSKVLSLNTWHISLLIS